ncbi:MAG: hypothetical protein K2Y26_00065 [Gemmatimonadaceae bacterium]|nr:hypothetical protein [Gemmatimonadaceae bacterium]
MSKALYLLSDFDVYEFTRRGDGLRRLRCVTDDVPESVDEYMEPGVFHVFDGEVIHPDAFTGDELDAMGVPETARDYDEWWHGPFREATPEEVAAVMLPAGYVLARGEVASV